MGKVPDELVSQRAFSDCTEMNNKNTDISYKWVKEIKMLFLY